MQNIEHWVKYILENGGITVNLGNRKIIEKLDAFLFPARPDLTQEVVEKDLEKQIKEFLEKYRTEILKENHYFGVWFDEEKKFYFLDVNIAVKGEKEAIKKAKEIGEKYAREIISLYNPKLDKTVYL